jgi:D-beta-D-heptose 7-phosphate kinase/D-beta-D-heptose 1-phosphate adenosyltransferase
MDRARLTDLLNKLRRQRLLVIGDVILDHYIWGDVDRISPEAPVPVVGVERESDRLGGAANVALNLSTLGIETHLLGRTGADAFGQRMLQLAKEAGIQPVGGLPDCRAGTIVKTRVVARQQQLCRLDREGARSNYGLEKEVWERVLGECLSSVDGVLVSDYAKGLVDDTFLDVLRDRTTALGKPVFVDPKPVPERNFHGFTLMTPNRPEALRMSGVEVESGAPFPAEQVVERLYARYAPHYLVVTLGAEGMLYAEKGEIGGVLPTFAREVFDVSGAGDTVISVLAGALLSGAALSEAVTLANTAAGIVVGKLGTAPVTAEELLRD